MNDLTTPDAVSRQLIKVDPNAAPNPAQAEYDDYYAYIIPIIRQTGAYISQQCSGMTFVPFFETRNFYPQDIVWPRQPIINNAQFRLPLRSWLLEIDEITWRTEEINSTHYRPATYRSGQQSAPYDTILFSTLSGIGIPYGGMWSGGFNDVLAVTGHWAYNQNPAYAYLDTSTLTAGVNATTTSIPVVSAAAFEILAYIRIGDELMQVTARNTSSNTLTVRRGVNGFVAAAHEPAAVVKVWQIQHDIFLIATRLAALAYQKKTDVGSVVQVLQTGVNIGDKPIFVDETIKRYNALNVWGAVV